MNQRAVAAAIAIPFAMLVPSACVSQQQYDAAIAENNQLKAQLAQSQAEQKFVEAGDLLFPSGGFQLSPAGQAEIANNVVPRLVSAKGFGDTHPVASNDTPQGRSANRRIEITVQGPGAPGA